MGESPRLAERAAAAAGTALQLLAERAEYMAASGPEVSTRNHHILTIGAFPHVLHPPAELASNMGRSALLPFAQNYQNLSHRCRSRTLSGITMGCSSVLDSVHSMQRHFAHGHYRWGRLGVPRCGL